MTKRIFAISTLALVLLIGAIFVYNFIFKKPTPQATAPKTSEEGKSSNAPTATTAKTDSGSVVAVSNEPAFGATTAPDGNSIYYFSAGNGQLNQIDFNGKLQKVVSTEEFQNIQSVIWSKSKNRAIIRRADGPNSSKFLLLDPAQKKVSPLKNNIDSVAWSGLGDKIIYKYFDSKTKKRTIEASDPDGSNWHKIADTTFFGVSICPVPGSSDISFWPTPDAYTATSATLAGFSGENKKEILRDRFGADLLWSPDGRTAAVSVADQKGGHKTDIALMNSDGGQFRSLNFPTFAKKCAWSADSKYLFCAMPGNIPDSAVLPNDWQENKIQTADTFWKIEIATGKKERLVEAEKIGGSYDALNPFLSGDEKTLFFTNKADGKLYKLNF